MSIPVTAEMIEAYQTAEAGGPGVETHSSAVERGLRAVLDIVERDIKDAVRHLAEPFRDADGRHWWRTRSGRYITAGSLDEAEHLLAGHLIHGGACTDYGWGSADEIRAAHGEMA